MILHCRDYATRTQEIVCGVGVPKMWRYMVLRHMRQRTAVNYTSMHYKGGPGFMFQDVRQASHNFLVIYPTGQEEQSLIAVLISSPNLLKFTASLTSMNLPN